MWTSHKTLSIATFICKQNTAQRKRNTVVTSNHSCHLNTGIQPEPKLCATYNLLSPRWVIVSNHISSCLTTGCVQVGTKKLARRPHPFWLRIQSTFCNLSPPLWWASVPHFVALHQTICTQIMASEIKWLLVVCPVFGGYGWLTKLPLT